MRTILIAASLLSSGFLRFCDNAGDKATAPVAQMEPSKPSAHADGKGVVQGDVKAGARADVNAAGVPSIGGSLVAIGAHRAEIALHQKGLVEGRVTLASGAAVPDPAKVKLVVTATGEGNARERVELKWNEVEQRFVGRARAKTELTSGPVDVELTIDDKTAQAKLAAAAVLGAPEFGGAVMAAGDYAVELLARPAGDVEAHVKNAAGATLDGSADIGVTAKLQAGGSGARDIALKWDPARAAFTGRADAGVELTPGRAEIHLQAGGPAHVGGLAQLTLAGVASHGGRVVVAGDYSVELVHKDGLLLAYVMDASGKAHAAGDLNLSLGLGAAAGTRLKWDPPSASYKANVAAGFNLAAHPVRVEIKVGGRSHVGAFGRLNAAAKAKADLNAKADVEGRANANANANANLAAKPPQVKAKADLNQGANAQAGVKAALPKVNVTAPKVNVTAPKVNTSATKSGAASGSARAGFSFGTK
jgi:hypothetical protein